MERYFATEGRQRRDLPRMYAKTALIFFWFASAWFLLVFVASSWWVGAPLAIALGLAVAAIGMSVQHDANHGAFSSNEGVNRALGAALDAMGASSYVWKRKHNNIHHTWTNLAAHDDDIALEGLARLAPDQAWRPWYRFQHIYVWALYTFLLPKWVFWDDWHNLFSGRIGAHRLARPSWSEFAILLGGKLVFVAWAIVIPLLVHPPLAVLLGFALVCATVGVTLAVTFQLAHCVEEAAFPSVADGASAGDFATHQLATTVDFARDSLLLTWFMGGLNFQVEHHLFPKVCHLHYPALARIVEATAADHAVRYQSQRSVWPAIRSHYRWLRRMGMRPSRGPSLAASG